MTTTKTTPIPRAASRVAKWVASKTPGGTTQTYRTSADWGSPYADVIILVGEALRHWDPSLSEDVVAVIISEAAETYGPYSDPWTYCGWKGLPAAIHNGEIDMPAGFYTEAISHYSISIRKDS